MPASEPPATLRDQQLALTRHLRDPEHHAVPGAIEERRLAIYRELLFNNIEGLLAGNFPVIRKLLGEAPWRALVRDFYRDHRCQTPLFPEIAREFLRFLEARPDAGPPFLDELAHYEWVELALQISEATTTDVEHDPADDPGSSPGQVLLDGAPVVSPLAWPLAYRWPVHQLGPDYRPDAPPETPTLLLLRREPDGSVRFSVLSPLAFRLLQRLGEGSGLSGREHLQALGQEAGTADVAGFVEQGRLLLLQMRASNVILGIVPPTT